MFPEKKLVATKDGMICLYQQKPNQMSFNHHVRTFGTTKNIIHVIEVPFLFIYVGTILLESVQV